MPFFGGRLWLDLLNTAFGPSHDRQDLVATPAALLRWLAAAGIAAPKADPEQASRAAVELRETLRQTVDRLRLGEPLAEDTLAVLNHWLGLVGRRVTLVRDKGGLRLEEVLDTDASGPMGAVVEDFARFVSDFDPARLKHCANPGCTMVFYDLGRNATRRWCTMSICGNRDKVARYRARKDRKGDA